VGEVYNKVKIQHEYIDKNTARKNTGGSGNMLDNVKFNSVAKSASLA
jgi:hypothetical protein